MSNVFSMHDINGWNIWITSEYTLHDFHIKSWDVKFVIMDMKRHMLIYIIIYGPNIQPNITNNDIQGYIMSNGFQNYEICIQILCKGRYVWHLKKGLQFEMTIVSNPNHCIFNLFLEIQVGSKLKLGAHLFFSSCCIYVVSMFFF